MREILIRRARPEMSMEGSRIPDSCTCTGQQFQIPWQMAVAIPDRPRTDGDGAKSSSASRPNEQQNISACGALRATLAGVFASRLLPLALLARKAVFVPILHVPGDRLCDKYQDDV